MKQVQGAGLGILYFTHVSRKLENLQLANQKAAAALQIPCHPSPVESRSINKKEPSYSNVGLALAASKPHSVDPKPIPRSPNSPKPSEQNPEPETPIPAQVAVYDHSPRRCNSERDFDNPKP